MFVTVWDNSVIDSQAWYDVIDLQPFADQLHNFVWTTKGIDGIGFSDIGLRVRLQKSTCPEAFKTAPLDPAIDYSL